MDPDGYFWFEGRDDDVITSSAYRIGPFEVESVLVEHPAVMEAAVVGKDDRRAHADRHRVLHAGAGSHRLTRARPRAAGVRQARAPRPYKYPREIYFVEELPKTISGKIRRSELRERLRTG